MKQRNMGIAFALLVLGLLLIACSFGVFALLTRELSSPTYSESAAERGWPAAIGIITLLFGIMVIGMAFREYKEVQHWRQKVLRWNEERAYRQATKPLAGSRSREFSATIK